MNDLSIFTNRLFEGVVLFDKNNDKLLLLDFTERNPLVTPEITGDISVFSDYIQKLLRESGATFGIGGYLENRTVYSRSRVFDADESGEEPRTLHLGIDIWGKAGTPVFTPIDGTVHSFGFNDQYGDYGATIILAHQLGNQQLHTLYGHLALKDLQGLTEGKKIKAGEEIAHFGVPEENGHWPPHLHFQLIWDMEGRKGDYPGVCKYSEMDKYASNCPDPDLVLDMMLFAS